MSGQVHLVGGESDDKAVCRPRTVAVEIQEREECGPCRLRSYPCGTPEMTFEVRED